MVVVEWTIENLFPAYSIISLLQLEKNHLIKIKYIHHQNRIKEDLKVFKKMKKLKLIQKVTEKTLIPIILLKNTTNKVVILNKKLKKN